MSKYFVVFLVLFLNLFSFFLTTPVLAQIGPCASDEIAIGLLLQDNIIRLYNDGDSAYK